ncbi:LOW QUALITY PROTEIN: CD109 antigen [Xyrichtys novacula]|uniref:LOW QUALITY PROTEIN: CD109 antigen n=1 Tax=Xyrichtys novacula TaxID=13765 RepID=A0AAV1GM35_XYRNO|nr:LOW QUALITY PROTEIN: CD109 antigen [Xyrichtys novacula]
MDWIWVVVWGLGAVFLSAVPGSSQDSPKTLFLISGPEVLHAGTSTSIAVTVFDDFSGRVVAEVKHGITKVAQTENFQGGLTRMLTLPPISGSITNSSHLNLTVRGYTGDTLIFTNTTTLIFSRSSVSTFIQTDKPSYQPGDTVKVRVMCVQSDNRPYKGRVDVSVQDPSGNDAQKWESKGDLGIILEEFHLSHASPLGEWAITTAVNGVTDKRVFWVEHYERPFQVLLKTPPQVLVGKNISGSVRALYPGGQPVQGTLAVSLTLVSGSLKADSPLMQTQNKELYGSTQFSFSKDLLQTLFISFGFNSERRVRVVASVKDSSTGYKVNTTAEIHLMRDMFQLSFQDYPLRLKPSLPFTAALKISRYDRKPLSLEDLNHSVLIDATQTTSTFSGESTVLTLPVSEDGNVHIKIQLQDQVEVLFIRARFQSIEETLRIRKSFSPPHGPYIQISQKNISPAQIGLPFQMNVESSCQPKKLHYVVCSRGQIVAAGTKNSSSITLTPSVSWSPEAFVTVYCSSSNREVTRDTARIPINQHNHVSLNWSSSKAQPGEQVALSVAVLEPGSQVGIIVMGTRHGSQQTDPDLKVEQDCDTWIMTNARLDGKNLPHGHKNDVQSLMVEKYWSHWRETSESLLWLDTVVSGKTWTSREITVPDGVTSLSAVALVMSDHLGLGFTPVPQKLSVSKDFSLSMDVPSYLIRGEEIVLEVEIINHLESETKVVMLLAQSESFEFVQADRRDVSVINAKKVILGSHMSAVVLFPIRPVALGEMEISVDAVSEEASDSLVWKVFVKPEGVEQFYSESLFLELAPVKQNYSRSVSFHFPDVVPGSQRAHVALVGEILALSFRNLGSLVQMPLGCGEQNMIRFAPSIYVLRYLDKSAQDDEEIRSRALGYMMEGYQRQLSFQGDDGSFRACGASSTSGSIWLTAFVLRCFFQAQPYIQIHPSVLTKARTWLLNHQGPNGEFIEVGRSIHTEMQGELGDGPVALTAFVLIALLEDKKFVDMYENMSQAQEYLEDSVSSGDVSNYTLCLVAYALARANSPLADYALSELSRRADYRDEVMMWQPSYGPESFDWQPHSTQIEMASYVLLALYTRGRLLEGIALMKWLSSQSNHLGGYGTTQATVAALQALACYAAFSGAYSIDLRLSLATQTSPVSLFSINSSNYRTYQSQEIDASKDINMNIFLEGRGFAVFQLNVFYNMDSKAFSQNLEQTKDKEAFLLDVIVGEERDRTHMQLSICTGLKNNQVIPRTGMVVMDVGMLSGFGLSSGAAAPSDLIRNVETQPGRVILYLDSLTKARVCITLPVVRKYKVAHIQDAVVHVYDKCEPSRRATRPYNSNALHNMDSCSFCGEACTLCMPEITVNVSTPLSSHSVRSVTDSWFCLFLGVISVVIVV